MRFQSTLIQYADGNMAGIHGHKEQTSSSIEKRVNTSNKLLDRIILQWNKRDTLIVLNNVRH